VEDALLGACSKNTQLTRGDVPMGGGEDKKASYVMKKKGKTKTHWLKTPREKKMGSQGEKNPRTKTQKKQADIHNWHRAKGRCMTRKLWNQEKGGSQ